MQVEEAALLAHPSARSPGPFRTEVTAFVEVRSRPASYPRARRCLRPDPASREPEACIRVHGDPWKSLLEMGRRTGKSWWHRGKRAQLLSRDAGNPSSSILRRQ